MEKFDNEKVPSLTRDIPEAISFAKSYFALVDGPAYGLENYLSEDVSLDWFGKTIKGKQNVAAFMRINMNNSKHIFYEISPASSINPRKKRRKPTSKGKDKNVPEVDEVTKADASFSKLHIDDSKESKEKSESEGSTSHASKNVEGSSKSVEQSSTSEKKDKSPVIDSESNVPKNSNSAIKFVKANGIVHIYRSSGPNKIRKWQSSSVIAGMPGQTCRRRCNLQVAYSGVEDEANECEQKLNRSEKECTSPEESPNSKDSKLKKGRKRFHSEEEMEDVEMISPEISFNAFEGFESLADTRSSMKYFETTEIPEGKFASPKYDGDQLIFDFSEKEKTEDRNVWKLNFKYTIHEIVYDCDMNNSNLAEEFKSRKSLSDTEKSVE